MKKKTVEEEFALVLTEAQTEAKELKLDKTFPKRPDNTKDKLLVLQSEYPSLYDWCVGSIHTFHTLINKFDRHLYIYFNIS